MRLTIHEEMHLPGFKFPSGTYEVADHLAQQLLELGAVAATEAPKTAEAPAKRRRPKKAKVETPED